MIYPDWARRRVCHQTHASSADTRKRRGKKKKKLHSIRHRM